MARYLVTGAQGFIGRHLVAHLHKHEHGAEVIAPGREHDLTDTGTCDRLFREAGALDYVFHLADVSGNAQWSAQNAARQFFANAGMALNVLQAVSRHQRAARLLGFSSLWAYPAALRADPWKEADYWSGPVDEAIQQYGNGKKFLGSGLAACKRELGMKGTMLVLGTVYGPGDRSDHLVPSLVRRMRENPRALEVQGDGKQERDFIYVEDQVRAIVLHKDYDGDLLNIGGGQPRPVRDVVQTLVRLLPYGGAVEYRAAPATSSTSGDHRRMDMSLAQGLTGWPGNFKLRALEEGLRLTLKGS